MKFINLVLFMTLVLSLQSCKDTSKSDSPNLTREITFKKQGTLDIIKKDTDSVIATFDIEIADNEYKTQTGLMYRSSMEKNQGMLFVFPDSQLRGFYMKNTEFSLDILYFDADKTLVEMYENTVPYDETSLPSGKPSMYVLEINGGLAEELGIEIGDSIDFERL